MSVIHRAWRSKLEPGVLSVRREVTLWKVRHLPPPETVCLLSFIHPSCYIWRFLGSLGTGESHKSHLWLRWFCIYCSVPDNTGITRMYCKMANFYPHKRTCPTHSLYWAGNTQRPTLRDQCAADSGSPNPKAKRASLISHCKALLFGDLEIVARVW